MRVGYSISNFVGIMKVTIKQRCGERRSIGDGYDMYFFHAGTDGCTTAWKDQ